MGPQPLAALQRTAGNRAVQRLVASEPAALDGEAISQRIGAAEGTGSALDPSMRDRLAEVLGSDPGEVRVHTDGEADALSRSLGAKAFTSGRDIFFRGGTFDPGSPEGFELLVHESTHVLQQAAGPVPGSATADGALAISDPGDAFEQAASANAEAPAAVTPSSESTPVQRDLEPEDLLAIAEQSQKGPGPLDGMLESFGSAIGDDAASGQLGMGTLTKAATTEQAREKEQGALLKDSQKGFDSFVDNTTAGFGSFAKQAGKDSGTGALGEGIGDYVDSAGRFTGGFAKELWGMGSGIESIVSNPLGFQQAQADKASKEAPALVTNQYFDTLGKVSRGEEGLGGAASELFGAFTQGKDNELAAQEAAAKPIVDDVKKGDYAGAFGRVGAQVGVAVLGLGEEGPLGELGAEASAAEEGGAAVRPVGTAPGAVAGETAGEVSPLAKSVPNPPVRPLEPPISPLADSVPNPTERGLPPTERGIPPTERELPLTEPGEPPTLRDPPRTLPGVAPDPNPQPGLGVPEGPSTLPGVAPDPNPLPDLGPLTERDPLTVPGLGAPEGPSTIPGLGTPEGPSTLPGVAPDPNPLPELGSPNGPATLESPTEFQGERVPGISPKADSVRPPGAPDPVPSPNPDPGSPVTERSPGNDPVVPDAPAPESTGSGPATADGDRLGQIQDEFDAAWSSFSKKPFGYGLLPGGGF